MRVERSFLVRIVEVYEGDPPDDWDMEAIESNGLNGDHDQYVCDNWKLVESRQDHDTPELLRDDQLEYWVI